MGVSRRATKFVNELKKKYPKEEQDDFDLAVKQVEMAKKSKPSVSAASKYSTSENERIAATDELRRREMNAKKRKEGKPEEKAPDYKDLREGYKIDKEDFAKGGMVTKKKAPAKAKAPATASRSHPLNKFYGK